MRNFVFLLFCWAFVLASPLGRAGTFQELSFMESLWLYPECTEKYLLECSDLPPTIKQMVTACQMEVTANKCSEYFKDDPENNLLIKKCTPSEICSEHFFESALEVYGCGKGFSDVTWDMVVGVVDMGKGIFKKAAKTARQRSAFYKYCNKSIACKRAMVEGHPYFKGLNDKQLARYSALDLHKRVTDYDRIKSFNEALQFSNLGIQEREDALKKRAQDYSKPEPQAGKALKAAAIQFLEDKNIKWRCFDVEARAELMCYGVFSVIDPTVVAGSVIKSARLARWISRFDLPKLPGSKKNLIRPRKGSTSRRNLAYSVRKGFVDEYSGKVFFNEKQNQAWMDLAKATKPKSGTIFYDVENAVLKNLNDGLKNKDLVTSLTNRHKEILIDKVKDLQKKYPGLKVDGYSDFKSTRFAFSGDIPPNFQRELNQIYKQANDEFFSDETIRAIVREDDLTGDWFMAGLGETADEATAAGRFARRQDSNHLNVQSFQSKHVRRQLNKDRKTAGRLQKKFSKKLKDTPLLTKADGSDTLIPDEGVFDILRKNSDPKDAQAALQARYGMKEVPMDQVEQLQEYAELVDQFSPGIHIAKREIVNFDEAIHGGLSIDFAGMGAHNARATAEALANSRGIDDALTFAREGEKKVTDVFNKKKDALKGIMNDSFDEGTVRTLCTGDDCVVTPTRALNIRDKRTIMSRIATQQDPSSVRLSFVPDGVVGSLDRTLLGTHGESVEKALRKHLSGQVEPEKLKGILFGVDMQGAQAGSGRVGLLIETAPSVRLTPRELELINDRLQDALSTVNNDLVSQGERGRYITAGIVSKPGPVR